MPSNPVGRPSYSLLRKSARLVLVLALSLVQIRISPTSGRDQDQDQNQGQVFLTFATGYSYRWGV